MDRVGEERENKRMERTGNRGRWIESERRERRHARNMCVNGCVLCACVNGCVLCAYDRKRAGKHVMISVPCALERD